MYQSSTSMNKFKGLSDDDFQKALGITDAEMQAAANISSDETPRVEVSSWLENIERRKQIREASNHE